MLSPADMVVIGAVALLVFGPDRLPKVARTAGRVIRDVQATSQSFIREMERAADVDEHPEASQPWSPPPPVEQHAEPRDPLSSEAAVTNGHEAHAPKPHDRNEAQTGGRVVAAPVHEKGEPGEAGSAQYSVGEPE